MWKLIPVAMLLGVEPQTLLTCHAPPCPRTGTYYPHAPLIPNLSPAPAIPPPFEAPRWSLPGTLDSKFPAHNVVTGSLGLLNGLLNENQEISQGRNSESQDGLSKSRRSLGDSSEEE